MVMHYRVSNIGAKSTVAWPFGSEGVTGHYIALKRSGYIAREILGIGGVFAIFSVWSLIEEFSVFQQVLLHHCTYEFKACHFLLIQKAPREPFAEFGWIKGPGEIISFFRLHLSFTSILLYGSQYLVRVKYFCLRICSRDGTKQRCNIT